MAANRGSPANSLSKERLKNELVAHGLQLPPPGSKKEVYVQIYEKNIASNASRSLRSEFSSDEEERSPRIQHRKIRKSVFTAVDHEDNNDTTPLVVGGLNIAELSDEELTERLRNLKYKVGPIVDSTRLVYQRKLSRLLRGEIDGEVTHQRYEDDFSDSDDDASSRHSTTPVVTHKHSPKSNDFISPSGLTDVRKRLPSDSIANSTLSPHDDLSAFQRPDFNRDTPTPRRSLRSEISYTPVDRSKYPNLLQSQNSLLNSSRDTNSVSSSSGNANLASKLVEQVEEPEPPKRSRKFILWIVIAIIVAVLAILVYQNMEESSVGQIDITSDKLELPAD